LPHDQPPAFALAGPDGFGLVSLTETWIEAELLPWLRFRAGKFLFPISQERLTPRIALPFVGTSLAAVLLPASDTWLQLRGTLADGSLSLYLALTDGAFTSGPGDPVANSGKDLVGRVYLRPFLGTEVLALRQVGVGLGASTGEHNGSASSRQLPILTTYGGQVFFSYAMGVASGRVDRLVPCRRCASMEWVSTGFPIEEWLSW
jgi:phosphate-selective porin OprO/OprP